MTDRILEPGDDTLICKKCKNDTFIIVQRAPGWAGITVWDFLCSECNERRMSRSNYD